MLRLKNKDLDNPSIIQVTTINNTEKLDREHLKRILFAFMFMEVINN